MAIKGGGSKPPSSPHSISLAQIPRAMADDEPGLFGAEQRPRDESFREAPL